VSTKPGTGHSDSFEAKRAELLADYPDGAEDPDEYSAENVFWVPKEARWSHLQANAKQPSIGKIIDGAMIAIEKRNETLKGVLPKDYARPALNAVMLGELIDLISNIALGQQRIEARDLLGRVYEYFLGQFAGSEGKRGGEFYTPRSVVRVMVEMIEPYKGRIYDPCCGSGGMFVQSEKFALEHEGRIGDIAIYGQESNYTTWRLPASAGQGGGRGRAPGRGNGPRQGSACHEAVAAGNRPDPSTHPRFDRQAGKARRHVCRHVAPLHRGDGG